ncbi:hypothetical protein BGX38DRAFT_1142379 [Terfezia claveryi]|nr:hypothetical protein BGX38DRAFT_1142379 [Terfezia claveryi]
MSPSSSTSPLPVECPSSVASPWTRPITNSGKRPSKKEVSDSMGIDESAYGFLMSLATNVLVGQIRANKHLADTNRWSNIHGQQKIEVYNAFSQKVADELKTRPDRNEIEECLKDQGIVNFFTKEGWVLARKRLKIDGQIHVEN